MERRNRDIKIIDELLYADSLDEDKKADALVLWAKKYFHNNNFVYEGLTLEEEEILLELFYKNIIFLKKHKLDTSQNLLELEKIKSFLDN